MLSLQKYDGGTHLFNPLVLITFALQNKLVCHQ
jgi:hypothetical protein